MTEHLIDRLFATIDARKGGDPDKSYVARLHGKGLNKIAEKMGEEAVETIVAAVAKDKADTVAESADLLFHLMVLWSAKGVSPAEVFAELARREGISGIEEKKGRTA
ncbi:phosphoribosyl-ATP diphosphatase [Iodidimonas sp. SYSU 1G8]|uniref:phosphoribosyl-ATP diphosphatase n=1 Tax=Iodidimonas sp. SYSU 1G8 TaxID=3133967 RepID=UPI0031FED4EE